MKKWKCTVCGYIHEGEEAPEKCPLCGAAREKFVEIREKDDSVAPTSTKEEQPRENEVSKMTQLVLENFLHPISVHSPNGIIPMVVLLLVPAVLFSADSFATAAYYSLLFVLLAMPPVMITGYITWRSKYKGTKTALFTMKIAAACVASATLLVLVVWKTVQPDVLTASAGRWPFFLLSLLLLASVGIAGHLGGKLVFSNTK